MNCLRSLCFGLMLAFVVPVWAQVEPGSPSEPGQVGTSDNAAVSNPDLMVTPPPVSGQSYPIELSSQERSNYLHGGFAFTSAYTDNALAGEGNTPISDVSYSIAPTIAVDETTSREHLTLTYAPGFTFYQRLSGLDASNQNAVINFEYRLSPHVTFSATDGFQKSSSVFNQPDLNAAGAVGGGAEGSNFSVIAPIAERLSNSGNAGLAYQFALNEMIGGSGTFTNLHYPNQAQVPGLYDSSSQAGLVFYALRLSRKQYAGVTYQYQRLLSYPTGYTNETQTHAGLLFYSVYPAKALSLSFFGGSQHSDTVQASPFLQSKQWTPAGGASLGWQGRWNSVALSFMHVVSSGGGMIGAVELDNAMASMRQRITRSLNASASGGYAQNDILSGSLLGQTNGHSISGTASLQQQFGQHVTFQLGYTRLRQDYSGIRVLALNPNTNREFVSISYQFARPLGR